MRCCWTLAADPLPPRAEAGPGRIRWAAVVWPTGHAGASPTTGTRLQILPRSDHAQLHAVLKTARSFLRPIPCSRQRRVRLARSPRVLTAERRELPPQQGSLGGRRLALERAAQIEARLLMVFERRVEVGVRGQGVGIPSQDLALGNGVELVEARAGAGAHPDRQ